MKFKAAGLSCLFLACCTSLAAAGPVADAAMRAEALQAEGKTVEALAALDEAVDAIWAGAPLAFRTVRLVQSAEEAAAERTDRTFHPDEKLSIHVEPVGFGYGPEGTDATISFAGDLALENATGQVLSEAKDVWSLSSVGRTGQREFNMTLSMNVPYVRPGDYVARVTLRDRNSDKSGSFDVPFTVAAPAAGAAQ